MSLARRLLPLGALLISTSGAWAFDDATLPPDREPACSSLCRSWMGLGAGEDRAPAAPAEVPAPPPSPLASEPSPVRTVSTLPAARPVRAKAAASRHGMPPLPPRRDEARRLPLVAVATDAAKPAPVPPIARPLPVSAALALPPPPAPPAADVSNLRTTALPAAVVPRPVLVEPAPPVDPAPARPVALVPQPIPPAADPLPPGAAGAPRPALAEPALPVVHLVPAQPANVVPQVAATPFPVKAAIYAVLAALAFLGLRSPRPSSAPVEAEASGATRPRVRRSARRRSPVGRLVAARD